LLTSGTRLGPYEIQALVGAGGTGDACRARDTRLDRTVAIKVLNLMAVPLEERGADGQRFSINSRRSDSLSSSITLLQNRPRLRLP
jgi:serine/threonine protein kinase